MLSIFELLSDIRNSSTAHEYTLNQNHSMNTFTEQSLLDNSMATTGYLSLIHTHPSIGDLQASTPTVLVDNIQSSTNTGKDKPQQKYNRKPAARKLTSSTSKKRCSALEQPT